MLSEPEQAAFEAAIKVLEFLAAEQFRRMLADEFREMGRDDR